MSIIPTPLTISSVPVNEHMSSWGVPRDQLTEGEKVKGLVNKCFGHSVGTMQK